MPRAASAPSSTVRRYSMLRYMPKSAHEDWDPVVLEGSRAAAGMPGFAAAGMSADDSRALQAYVVDRAWAAYERPR